MLQSRLGISFTVESIAALRRYAIDLAKTNNSFLYLVSALDENGQFDVIVAGDRVVRPYAIPDQLGDAQLYWHISQPELDKLREEFCLDVQWGIKTRLIPLAIANDT